MSDHEQLILAVELHGAGVHPHAWRRTDSRAEQLFSATYWTDLIERADRAGVDLAFIPDSFALQANDTEERGQLDAVAVTARAAATTQSIGLVPTVTVTHTEPFHVSKQIASLDFATHGRAGWEVAVSPGAAALFGRKGEQDAASLWDEATDAVEVVTRLWDSWEDDAEIREASTGRFIDRNKLHYIDFSGTHFSVKGPSITPRSPQGKPVVVIAASDEQSTRLAVVRADIIRISAPTLDAAGVITARLRRAVVAAGRDPNEVPILLDVEVLVSDSDESAASEIAELDAWAGAPWEPRSVRYHGTADGLETLLTEVYGSGTANGVTLRPLALPSGLRRITEQLRPAEPPTGLLRGRLGLEEARNQYAGSVSEGSAS